MSILIRGMEMPKSCWQCQLLEGHRDDGLCKAANRWLDDDDYFDWYQYQEGDIDTSKPINCPLIEVPTPHGDLIDINALTHEYYKKASYHHLCDCLYDAPIVIPADKEATNG